LGDMGWGVGGVGCGGVGCVCVGGGGGSSECVGTGLATRACKAGVGDELAKVLCMCECGLEWHDTGGLDLVLS
jgi:hypothetical protein